MAALSRTAFGQDEIRLRAGDDEPDEELELDDEELDLDEDDLEYDPAEDPDAGPPAGGDEL